MSHTNDYFNSNEEQHHEIEDYGKGIYELSRDDIVIKKKANTAQLKIYKKRASESVESACGSDMNTVRKL